MESVEAESLGAAEVVSRLERLPFSRWHVRARLFVGAATFLDAYNTLTIAYALPVLVPRWHINPESIGLLFAIGYIGQLVGSFLFGRMAERSGRLWALTWSAASFGLLSFGCALAWGYWSLFAFRFLQGIGLGGEVPIAVTYVNEIARAQGRGRFVLLYEFVYSIGLAVTALVAVYIVPHWGWRWMFALGGLAALVAVFLRRLLPESPRWLVQVGRHQEAIQAVERIEAAVEREGLALAPPVAKPIVTTSQDTDWTELLSGFYRRRTLVVWVMWFVSYFIVFGLTTWVPTLFATVYKLPVTQSLQYNLVVTLSALCASFICALAIDRVGRRRWFVGAFAFTALTLLPLGVGSLPSLGTALVWICLGRCLIGTSSLALYLYTPEIYPTRMRAFASSVGSAWYTVAAALGTFVLGLMLQRYSLSGGFLIFAGLAAAGAVVAAVGALETRGRILEELSP